MPLVTILVPTYKQPEYILDAINSCVKIKYPKLEILILDDSEDEETSAIVRSKLSANINYVHNKTRLGRVANYNNGLSIASGKYILNLDGDDYYSDENFVLEAVSILEKNSNIVAVTFEQEIKNTNGSIKHIKHKYKGVVDGKKVLKNWFKIGGLSHLSTMYKREKAMQCGFYGSDILSTDWASFLKLCSIGDVYFVRRPIGVWRLHNNNASKTLDPVVHISNMKFIDDFYSFASISLNDIVLANIKKSLENNYIKIYFQNSLLNLKITTALSNARLLRSNRNIKHKLPVYIVLFVMAKKILNKLRG
jgi:glycosyltransferase involved in cell wall biosynthesis